MALRLTLVACVAATVVAGGASVHAGAALPLAEILFVRSASDDRADVYVMAADGSKPRLLIKNADWAAASPDGQLIAFQRGKAIWVMRRDGTDQTRLTTPLRGESAFDSEPAWSPDGRTIYFSRTRSFDGSIYAMRSDGTGLRRLTRGSASANAGHGVCHHEPAPSPDGRLIAYDEYLNCDHGSDSHMQAVTTRGEKARLGFTVRSWNCGEPTWAPTGKRLAYDCWSVDETDGTVIVSESGIFVSTAGGSRQLVRGFGYGPKWSPDGSTIAFYREPGIWRVNPDGKSLRRLARTGFPTGWLPPAR